MNKIKAVIIEDENPAARLLDKMLKELRPEWEIVILPGIVDEAVKWFSCNPHPDVIFLDIHLLNGNSFRFIEQAKPDSMIIFTTAYDEYAIRAFSVNSIDYLLKPIHKERLAESIAKFERLYHKEIKEYKQLLDIQNVLQQLSDNARKYRTRFLITYRDSFMTLQVSDIAYFYTENKITFAKTYHNKSYSIDISLNKPEEQLDGHSFFRVNRQFIVSANAIKKVEPYFLNKVRIQVEPPYEGNIQVSRERVTALKVWLNY
ncbi:MAG: LytTR family DNA-binding domain-containing protein [Parabacteroides sp.]|nr:LytTR family DNA-binding domain-containing protein [Parabacteroides sp.]